MISPKMIMKQKEKLRKRKMKEEKKNIIRKLKQGDTGFDIHHEENYNFFKERGFLIGTTIDYDKSLWHHKIYCDEAEIPEKVKKLYDFS